MKWVGVIAAVLGGLFLRAVWWDPVEGRTMRPAACVIIAAGVLIFVEGVKREIIAAVRKKE